MCCKSGQKLSALLILSPHLGTNKRKIIYTTMVKSQSDYCPLVWMFCPKRSRNLINKVQESTSYKLQQPIKQFLISLNIYNIINHIAPQIMSSLFEILENIHNKRSFQALSNESRRKVNYTL